MANSYKDIIITPNRSNTADPKIEFRGGNTTVNTAITIQAYPTSNGTLSFEGSAGQLFSVTNDLSGSIFSVNDVSGIPSIEVFANGQINFAQYGGNITVGGNTTFGAADHLILSSTSGISANGTFGTAGQALVTNGSAVYWSNNTGYTGSKGDQGVIGYTGSQGSQGVVGYTGSQGSQGNIGYTGSQGPQGIQGYTGSWGGTALANVNMNGYSITNANTITTGNTTVTGFANVSSTLQVAGNATLNGGVIVKSAAPSISGGTLTLDLATATEFDVALNAAITSIVINNVASAPNVSSFVLTFTADGTARAVTWPASFKWPGGTAPTLTSTLNKIDVFVIYTNDGGTSWQAFISGQNL